MSESLRFRSVLDDTQFQSPLRRMQESAATTGKKISKSLSSFGEGIAGGIGLPLGLAAAGGAAIELGKSLIDLASDLQNTSDALGISVQALQEYQFAFSQSGTSTEQFRSGLGSLTQSMVKAGSGSKDTILAFRRLGVTFDDLQNNAEDPQKILDLMADGVKNAKDPTQAYADVVEILGKAGKNMAAGMKDGSSGLKSVREEVTKLSDQDVKRWDDLGNAIQRFWLKTKVMAMQGATGLFHPDSWKRGGLGPFDSITNQRSTTTPDPNARKVGPMGNEDNMTTDRIWDLSKRTNQEKDNHQQWHEERRKMTEKEIEDRKVGHEAEMDAATKTNQLEHEAADIRESSMRKYLGHKDEELKLTKEIRDLDDKRRENDPAAAAEAEKLQAQKMAELKESRVRRNLMSNEERLAEKRQEGEIKRAAAKADRQLTRDLNAGGERGKKAAEQVARDKEAIAKKGKVTLQEGEMDKLASKVAGAVEKLLVK